jgi:hypothetical protein
MADDKCIERHWFLLDVEELLPSGLTSKRYPVTVHAGDLDVDGVKKWMAEELAQEWSWPPPGKVVIHDVKDCGWLPDHEAQGVLEGIAGCTLDDVLVSVEDV